MLQVLAERMIAATAVAEDQKNDDPFAAVVVTAESTVTTATAVIVTATATAE